MSSFGERLAEAEARNADKKGVAGPSASDDPRETIAQATKDDPWLGGPSGSPRYTPKQRHNMIALSIKRNGHRGCNCPGCKAHPGKRCPLWELPEDIDVDRYLTSQHLGKGPGDHHLSNVDAYCGPCNGNAPQLYAQRTPTHPHTPTQATAADTLAALEARREEVREDPTASAGHRTNLDHEPDYRRACLDFLLKSTKDPAYRFTRSQMNASARELSDAGRDAAYGYAARLFSHEGPLTDKDPVSQKKGEARFKDPADYRLSLEELEAKYPKEGRQK